MPVPTVEFHETITTPHLDAAGQPGEGFRSTQTILVTGTILGDVELAVTDDRGELRLLRAAVLDGRQRRESVHVWLTEAGLQSVHDAVDAEEGAGEEYADDEYAEASL